MSTLKSKSKERVFMEGVRYNFSKFYGHTDYWNSKQRAYFQVKLRFVL